MATDINPRLLQKSLEGVYGEWSFRGVPVWIKQRYFAKTKGGRFAILPQIKKLVSFSYLNLAEDAYPSVLNNTNAMDVIFCRNVIQYFAQQPAKKVSQQLYRSLVDDGWLVVSPSEISEILFPKFITRNFPGVILYKKDIKKSQMVEEFLLQKSQSGAVRDETVATFQPPDDFVPERELQLVLSEESRESSSRVDGNKNLEPQRTGYQEALALYEQGQYEEAATKIVELFSDGQENSKAVILLARVYANQGKLAEALEWCERAVATDKLNPDGHFLLAAILQEQGRVQEAAVSLQRVLYLNQNFVLAHFALENLTWRQGKKKESNRYLENTLSLLSTQSQEDILPGSDGITVGRLMQIVQANSELVS